MIIKTLIADDSKIFRENVNDILKKQPTIQLVGEAVNGEEAIRKTRELKPDLIVMDIRMPAMDGINATSIIKKKFPDVKIIVVSVLNLREFREAALTKGAEAFILKRKIYHQLYPEIESIFNLS